MHTLALLLLLSLPVNSVRCGEWERTDTAFWRAEGAAQITLADGGTVSVTGPVDVTVTSSPSLFWTLEYLCRQEIDGGM